ncbi:hypothetical protein ES703_71281 [subsurface metagenome]
MRQAPLPVAELEIPEWAKTGAINKHRQKGEISNGAGTKFGEGLCCCFVKVALKQARNYGIMVKVIRARCTK